MKEAMARTMAANNATKIPTLTMNKEAIARTKMSTHHAYLD